MNDTKEKSAVGMAVPATEMNNNTSTYIISGNEEKIKMPGKIKAVLQRPGELSEIVSIDNTIEEMNRIVGGMSTAVTIPGCGLQLVMNVNTDRRHRKPTLRTLWGMIYGNVIITNTDKKRYFSLTPEQIQSARGWLLRHIYEEESYEN